MFVIRSLVQAYISSIINQRIQNFQTENRREDDRTDERRDRNERVSNLRGNINTNQNPAAEDKDIIFDFASLPPDVQRISVVSLAIFGLCTGYLTALSTAVCIGITVFDGTFRRERANPNTNR